MMPEPPISASQNIAYIALNGSSCDRFFLSNLLYADLKQNIDIVTLKKIPN